MKKWAINASVVGGKFLGIVEAATEEEAIQLGWKLDNATVSLCHQCASECEDAEIIDLIADEDD